MLRHILLAATAIVGTAACTPAERDANTAAATGNGAIVANDMTASTATAAGRTATATLRTADGAEAGTVTATEADGAIRLEVAVRGMPAGVHGAHVHAVGKCEAPKFESATGHWNPAGRQHGTENAAGPHAGDAPNITVAANGTGSATLTLPAGDMAGMLDADGASFIIHATADDYRTDPSGNSGDRLACGVFNAA